MRRRGSASTRCARAAFARRCSKASSVAIRPRSRAWARCADRSARHARRGRGGGGVVVLGRRGLRHRSRDGRRWRRARHLGTERTPWDCSTANASSSPAAASGIGAAAARRMAAEGAEVALLDRDADGLSTRSQPSSMASVIVVDVADTDAVGDAVDAGRRAPRRPDVDLQQRRDRQPQAAPHVHREGVGPPRST